MQFRQWLKYLRPTCLRPVACKIAQRCGLLLAIMVGALDSSALATAPMSAADYTSRDSKNIAGSVENFMRLAKAKAKLVVAPEISAEPGSSVAIPVTIQSSGPIEPTAHVIIDGTPDWMTLSAGESVGDGVWLLRASQLKDVKIELSADAKGERKMGVLLVDQNGKITGETQFLFKVRTISAAASPNQRKTWRSHVGDHAAPVPMMAGIAPRPAKSRPAPAPAPKIMTAGAVFTPRKNKAKKLSPAQATAYAKHLVQECTTCHSLFGSDDGIPVMVGLKVDRFIDTMDLYKRGKRDNLVMINVARSLNDQQVRVLAEYLGAIKPAARVTEKRQRQRLATRRAAPTAPKSAARLSTGSISGGRKAHTRRKITEAKLKRAVRWVAKAQGLLKSGRIAQARLWLRRAVDYGVAEAAMLLGSSFDPNFMQTYAGYGLKASPAQARDWYIYARQLGSQQAVRRLAALPSGG